MNLQKNNLLKIKSDMRLAGFTSICVLRVTIDEPKETFSHGNKISKHYFHGGLLSIEK